MPCDIMKDRDTRWTKEKGKGTEGENVTKKEKKEDKERKSRERSRKNMKTRRRKGTEEIEN